MPDIAERQSNADLCRFKHQDWSSLPAMPVLEDDALSGAFDDLEAALGDVYANGEDKGPTPCERGSIEIPGELVAYVESICKSPWIAQQVLDVASTKVLRRLRNNTERSRRARWTKRWAPENQERTRRWLGQIRDRVVRLAHHGQVAERMTYSALPSGIQAWKPNSSGDLLTCESIPDGCAFGTAAYMEQTPVEVIHWVHETWQRERTSGSSHEGHSARVSGPRVWDLTTGSGTGLDYFSAVPGALIVASDITIGPAAVVVLADCRDVGTLDQHRGVGPAALARPSVVVRHPDLILFDPPSRGTPTHAELYDGTWPMRDLARLDREAWLMAIAFTVSEAVGHLAAGGFMSLLLRCGFRRHGAVEADVSALNELKDMLKGRVRVVDVKQVVFGAGANQASLGQARVPAVHLLIGRAQ